MWYEYQSALIKTPKVTAAVGGVSFVSSVFQFLLSYFFVIKTQFALLINSATKDANNLLISKET